MGRRSEAGLSRAERRDERAGSNAVIRIEWDPWQLILPPALMGVTTVVQTIGVLVLADLVLLWRHRVIENTTWPRMLAAVSGVVLYLFVLHLAQISLWAVLYQRVATYPSLAVAVYESALAFTTM